MVERKTMIVPFKAAVRYDPTGLALEVGDHFLILHFEHYFWRQNASPVRHQSFVIAVNMTQFGEVVAIRIVVARE